MKTRTITRRDHGGALVLALLVSLLGTAGIVSMVHMVGARGKYVDTLEHAVARRVTVQNSKSLGKEYILRGPIVYASNSATTLQYPSSGDAWAKVAISAWSDTTAPIATQQAFGNPNRFSPGNNDGYGKEIVMTISTPVFGQTYETSDTYEFAMKSHSPVTSGELFHVHKKASGNGAVTISGDIIVNGKMTVWDSANVTLSGLTLQRFESFGTVTGGGAAGMLPGNASFPVRTTGETANGPTHEGEMILIYNPVNPANTVVRKIQEAGSQISVDGNVAKDIAGVVCDGAGTVSVTMDSITLTHVTIGNNVHTLNLVGQNDTISYNDAAGLQAVTILVGPDAANTVNLNTISLQGANSRRMVLAVRSVTGNTAALNIFDTSNILTWRGVLIFENQPISYGTGNALQSLVGGIQTDSSFISGPVGTPTLTLNRELDPDDLAYLLPRDSWVEMYAD